MFDLGSASRCNPVTEVQASCGPESRQVAAQEWLASHGCSSPLHTSLATLRDFSRALTLTPHPPPFSQDSFPVADESHGKKHGGARRVQISGAVKALPPRRMSSTFNTMRRLFFARLENCPQRQVQKRLSHDNIVGERTRPFVRFFEDLKLFNDLLLCSLQAFCAKEEVELSMHKYVHKGQGPPLSHVEMLILICFLESYSHYFIVTQIFRFFFNS